MDPNLVNGETPTEQSNENTEPDSSNLQPQQESTTPAPDTPTSNGNGAWSPAVGKATLGPKSSRVIERLMGDVDRLRRELTLATAKCDEEQRRADSAKSALESALASINNFEAMYDTTSAALARRDRKIESLKLSLEEQTKSREKAETEKKTAAVTAQEAVSKMEKEVVREKEVSLRVTSQYDQLRDSFSRGQGTYQSEIQKLRSDLDGLRKERLMDQQKFDALEGICTQLRADYVKSSMANRNLQEAYEAYKAAAASFVQDLIEQLKQGERANNDIHEEIQKTMGQMKYVMNVQRDFKDEHQPYYQANTSP